MAELQNSPGRAWLALAWAAAAVLDIEHIGQGFANFRDTAHAMKCLDLVITCDTSVAHMAGTVGVPTWVLLTTYRTYWVWAKSETRAWYPSMECFRQREIGRAHV